MRTLSPITRAQSLLDMVDNMMNRLAGQQWQEMLTTTEGFVPAVDIEEHEGKYLIFVDLPGFRKEDIQVEVQENSLSISGERKWERKGESKYCERSWGRFSRSFSLPKPIDVDNVTAKYENGVLNLELPIKNFAQGKSIKIH